MLAQQQLSRAGLSPHGHGCCPAAKKRLVWACLKSLAFFLLGSKFSFNQKVCPHRSCVTRQAASPASSLSRVLLAGSCWVGHWKRPEPGLALGEPAAGVGGLVVVGRQAAVPSGREDAGEQGFQGMGSTQGSVGVAQALLTERGIEAESHRVGEGLPRAFQAEGVARLEV